MVKTIEALFDGTVFHPTEPVALAPNTRVRMTIETMLPAEGAPRLFSARHEPSTSMVLQTGQRTSMSICTVETGHMQAEVFLDTAYAIALSSPNDQFHARASNSRISWKPLGPG